MPDTWDVAAIQRTPARKVNVPELPDRLTTFATTSVSGIKIKQGNEPDSDMPEVKSE
jgi:hypothetical protein